MDKVPNYKLRRMVFEAIDENKNGKVDTEESKAPIFGLKPGDTKIKRKNFNKELAQYFLNAVNNGQDVKYKADIRGNADIDTCYKCSINEKDIGADVNGENNIAIIQHDGNKTAKVTSQEVKVFSEGQDKPQVEKEVIGLCVECNAYIVDNTVEVTGQDNTVVHQSNRETIIVEHNKEDFKSGSQNEVNIEDCVECNKNIENNHTTITGKNNRSIIQFDDGNQADIED